MTPRSPSAVPCVFAARVLAACVLVATGCNSGLGYYVASDAPPTPGDDPAGTSPPATDTTSSLTGSTSTPDSGSPPTPTGSTSTGTPPDTGTAPAPWVNGDPTSPPPYGAPPPNALGGPCGSIGFAGELDDDEVDVLSHDGTLEVRTLTSPVRGWYDLYDVAMAREGDGEWNESAMVRILNPAQPAGLPAVANCDDDWVTLDADNASDPGDTLFYVGTFWFEFGDNTLELEHVCPRIRAGRCTALEFLDDGDTTCAADDGNSAHLVEDGLCLVAPAP